MLIHVHQWTTELVEGAKICRCPYLVLVLGVVDALHRNWWTPYVGTKVGIPRWTLPQVQTGLTNWKSR